MPRYTAPLREMAFPPLQSIDGYYVIEEKSKTNKIIAAKIWETWQELKKMGINQQDVSVKGDALLVKTRTTRQAQQLENLTTLVGREVKATRDPYLNSCKGTIYKKELMNYNDEEILEALQEENPDVLKTWRIKKRDHKGELQNTPLVIITFNRLYPPDHTYFGWLRCQVRPYIDPPRRCFNCQRYGQSGKKMLGEEKMCLLWPRSHPRTKMLESPTLL